MKKSKRGEKNNEYEAVHTETSQGDLCVSNDGCKRDRMSRALEFSLDRVAVAVEAIVYRTWRGFGIVLWLALLSLCPLLFLWVLLYLPFPLNILLVFGGIFGFSLSRH